MASAGIQLDELLTQTVKRVLDEHRKTCRFKDGADERILAKAKAHAAVLGEAIEDEEIECSDPSDPFGPQEN